MTNKHNKATEPTRTYFSDKLIKYHPVLEASFDSWAADCGSNSERLRKATEEAITTRHHDAYFEHESHQACGNQPDIFTLSLGSVDVTYTVEEKGVIVRGYGWQIDHEPLDDWDGGGFFTESSW